VEQEDLSLLTLEAIGKSLMMEVRLLELTWETILRRALVRL
jgi:hypothetical protein